MISAVYEKAEGTETVEVLWEMVKAFEHVSPDKLWKLAAKLDYPMATLRLSRLPPTGSKRAAPWVFYMQNGRAGYTQTALLC